MIREEVRYKTRSRFWQNKVFLVDAMVLLCMRTALLRLERVL